MAGLKLLKEAYTRKRAEQRDLLKRRSSEYLEALDAKESMLEVQQMLLAKLAIEENKRVGQFFNPERLNELLMEAEEALSEMLRIF